MGWAEKGASLAPHIKQLLNFPLENNPNVDEIRKKAIEIFFPLHEKIANEQAKEEIQVLSKPPLNPKHFALLIKLESEEEGIKAQKSDENSMLYACVAANHFDDLHRQLAELITLENPFEGGKLNILEWIEGLPSDIKNGYDLEKIKNAIQWGFLGENFNENKHRNLVMEPCFVWGLTFSVIKATSEKNLDPRLLYLDMLHNQCRNCPTGGIRRNFMILMLAYKSLIANYDEY